MHAVLPTAPVTGVPAASPTPSTRSPEGSANQRSPGSRAATASASDTTGAIRMSHAERLCLSAATARRSQRSVRSASGHCARVP